MKPPLYQDFTGTLASDKIDELLAGSYEVSPSVNSHARAFLHQCRSTHQTVQMPVTPALNKSFWQRNPENKGSSPGGLHNGHYKAASFSPILNKIDALLRDIPMRTGMSPEAHHHVMNFAIEKKPGVTDVAKMRTIQMMDAEYQASNKQVGRLAMIFAERYGLVPEGQCGARKKHQAIDLALSKRLVWDRLFMEGRRLDPQRC